MDNSLPIWRIFNYLAKTWYDMPTGKLGEFEAWYLPSINLVWDCANRQEIDRRASERAA